MVVCLIACFQAVIQLSIGAQGVSTGVDGRVDYDVNRDGVHGHLVAQDEDDSEKSGSWEIGAVVSAAYDSNVFLSATNPTSDMIYKVGPVLGYKRGGAAGREGGFLEVAYQPTGVIYAANDAENRIDHRAAINGGWRGKVTRVTYKGIFEKLGDPTADTGRPTDRIEVGNELRTAWVPREKITLEAAVGSNRSEYDDATFFDSHKTYGEIAVRYAYSPKTEIGIACQAGRFNVDGASPQSTQQLTASFNWQPRSKVRIDLSAGGERRSTDNGSQLNPVLDGRVDWTPREGTGVYLTAYQKQEASAFFAGQNYQVKGVTAGVSQRLGAKWTALLEAGRESNSYSRVSGTGSSGRDDRIWFVRPALEYKVSENSKIALFYRASENRSNDAEFGYDQHVAGIELNHQF